MRVMPPFEAETPATAASAWRCSFGSVRASASLSALSRARMALALRLVSARVSVEVGVRRVLRPICCRVWAKKPALELNAGLGGAFAALEFVQGGFGAVGEGFVVDDRGVADGDEFEEVGLAFVGEEVGVVGGQGGELVEEGLLGL
jgi:hypothetical protein